MIQRILALLALAVAATPAAPQASPPGNLPVAIVLVEELPFARAKAVLVRRKDMSPQNLVLVTQRTSAGDLTRAMATLALSRKRNGDKVSSDLVAPIQENRSMRRSKDHTKAAKDLEALRTARARFIEGVGARPVLFSHLNPPTRGRPTG